MTIPDQPTAPGADPVTRLSDYRPPTWRIDRAELVFDLGLADTEVGARLHLSPDPDQPGQPLRLDGEELELLSIALDGAPLPATRYRLGSTGLTVHGVDSPCLLETRVRVHPERNTRLEGLYASRGLLITQCEAEGFRRITFFLDRPDVMPRWTIELRGETARFPVLLANGNPARSGALPMGRHFAVWENPHPTPAYLFALVAGRLECLEKTVAGGDGRKVRLAVWAEPADVPRCAFALEAVERALRWDERRFSRHYDLDVFNVVAVQDFTMGAMENKGLNVFNARFILADPESATDLDFLAIEAVIGHEYFHNWSGNRVTLRDWFQLSLKEGFTVFREQEFTADLHSRAVKRIEDVRLLRARQFAEDAGSLAHPVRPSEYREINNFYTLTVYEKGAELVRMLHTLLGEAAFRQGCERYFAENDGRAATVEDFLAALAAGSGRDLGAFIHWYGQAGTPELHIEDRFDAANGIYTLDIRQSTPATPGQPDKRALPIPLKFALYGADDRPIARAPTAPGAALRRETEPGIFLLELTGSAQQLVVDGLDQQPLPAFNQGFGAPVKLHYDYSPAQLGHLARIERDPFNRWEALQRLATGLSLHRFEDAGAALAALSDGLGALLEDDRADPAFVGECLTLPDFDTLAEQVATIDVDALLAAREELFEQLAEDHADRLERRYRALTDAAAGGLDGPAMAARALRNVCLHWLTRLDPNAALAHAQLAAAGTMTERLGALRCLVRYDAPGTSVALSAFRERWRSDPLVTDKWLALVATRPDPDAIDDVRELLESPWWTPTNPNRVRAVLGSLARMNPVAFHRADGAGYALLTEQLPALDVINPQVAARLLGAFESWRRLAGPRRDLAESALRNLQGCVVSRDCADLLHRMLG
ncbi:MAG: aminopeptidase N [Xanthomonadaceae bacterium]|nr:aminopeptidase N [Xanthomonadaceae bacterium]